MSKEIEKESEIKVKVGLNKNQVPVDIKWRATDSENQEMKDCKSIMLAVWDPYEKNTLSINLWTDQMTVDEMHAHFFRTLTNLTNSYYQATSNPEVIPMMESMIKELAKKTSDWEESKEKSGKS